MKKTFWIVNSILLSFLIQIKSYSQNIAYCGVVDVEPINMANISSTILNNAPILNVGINYFIVKDSLTGSMPNSTFNINDEIAYANNKFADAKIHFYLCKTIIIESSKSKFITLQNNWEALYYKLKGNSNDLYSTNDKINVYHVNSINNGAFSGFARFPSTQQPNNLLVVSDDYLPQKSVLTHELGHYFGLPHTFNGSIPSIDRIPYVSEPGISFVTQNGITYNLGDGIDDTPSDPGIDVCWGLINSSSCTAACSRGDLGNVPYDVIHEPANIMSYRCQETFSAGQNNVIRANAVSSRVLVTFNSNSETCKDYGNINMQCGVLGNLSKIPVKSADVNISIPTTSISCNRTTDAAGKYLTSNCISIGTNQIMKNTPAKNGTLTLYASRNGISTQDLVDINRHVLLIQLLQNPYSWIAADVNYDGKVSTADMVKIRKVLLQIPNEENFDNTGSWRFVPDWYHSDPNFTATFNDLQTFGKGPFMSSWKENQNSSRAYKADANLGQKSFMDYYDMNTNNSAISLDENWSFTGIKTGDVNCTAKVDALLNEDDERLQINILPHLCIITGDTATFSLKATTNQSLVAYQTEFAFNNLATPLALPNGDGNPINIFNINSGQLIGNPGEFYNILTTNNSKKLKVSWMNDVLNQTNLINGVSILQFDISANQNVCDISQLLSTNGEIATQLYGLTGKLNNVNLVLERVDIQSRSASNFEKSEININPNPFKDELNFTFSNEKEQKIAIVLYNSLGQELNKVEKTFPIGINSYTFSNLSKLPKGQIHYRMIKDNKSTSSTLR